MCCVQPCPASTPAKAGGEETIRAGTNGPGPVDRGVEVGHDLCVGYLEQQFANEGPNIGMDHRITLPDHQVRRDGKITLLRKAASEVGDVLV